MLINGRGVDQEFSKSEQLYRWFSSDCHPLGTSIPIFAIELPDVSVNRSKHGGKKEYVLYNGVNGNRLTGKGILQFLVEDVPERICIEGECDVDFRILHCPLEYNYYHAEIQAHDKTRGHLKEFVDGQDDNLWQTWRLKLRRKMKVVQSPSPQT